MFLLTAAATGWQREGNDGRLVSRFLGIYLVMHHISCQINVQWVKLGSRCLCGDETVLSKLLKFDEQASDCHMMEVLIAETKVPCGRSGSNLSLEQKTH